MPWRLSISFSVVGLRPRSSAALQRASGVQKRAAELLGLKPTTLNEMLKRHGMLPRDTKEANEPEPASPSRATGL